MADRAAKKRGKVWRGVLIVVASFALVVGGMVWVVWPYVMAEAPTVDLEPLEAINALILKGQPEGENGWERLRRTLVEDLGMGEESMGAPEWHEISRFDPAELMQHAWDDPRLARHREALRRANALLKDFDGGASTERFFIPYRSDGEPLSDGPDTPSTRFEAPTGVMISLHRVSQWRLMAAREAAIAGDWALATERLRASFALGQRMSRQALYLEWVIGLSLCELAMMEMRLELNELDVPASVCDDWLSLLAEFAWPYGEVDRVVDGEDWHTEAFIREMFSDSGVYLSWRFNRHLESYGAFLFGAASPLEGPPSLAERMKNAIAMGRPRASEVQELRRESTERQRAILHERYGGVDKPFDLLSRLMEPPDDLRRQIVEGADIAYLVRRALWRHEAAVRATAIMLRLEVYHAEHGRWPAALAEAMSEGDLVDPVTGRAFEFRLLEEAERPYEIRYPAGAPYIEVYAGDDRDLFVVNPARSRPPLASEIMEGQSWDDDAGEDAADE